MRLRLAELLRLMQQLFPIRDADRQANPVPEELLETADERLAAGLCMIAESLGSSEDAVLEVLRKAKIEVRRARSASDIPRLVADRMPDFVITGPGADTARIAQTLKDAGYKGPLQSVGALSSMGFPPPPGIRVLPAIAATAVETDLFAVLHEDGMVRGQNGLVSVDLNLAARKGWLHFWYLPKINLRQSRLHGAELLPLIDHPRHGLLDPVSCEIAGKDDLRILGYSAIRAAVKDWTAFGRIGFSLEFSTNASLEAFDGREMADVIDGVRPADRHWNGLRVELDARSQMPDEFQIHAFKRALRTEKAWLSLDHVTRPGQLADGEGRFAEVKLDGSLIDGCADDREKQDALRAVMDLASRSNSLVAATDVRRRADLHYLMANHETLSFGQGPIFAPAVSRSQFIRLLQTHVHQATMQFRVPRSARRS